MKTHLFLKFEYKDTNWKVLISRLKLPLPIRDIKFIEIADFSPSATLFCFKCDKVNNYYTNCVENLLGVGLGGVGSKESYKASASGDLYELVVEMSRITPKVIYHHRQKWSRAHVVVHSGDLEEFNDSEKMKKTSFMLKLRSDETEKRQTITYKLPKPLFDCKYIQAVDWFGSGGYDYITCPQIKDTFSNDLADISVWHWRRLKEYAANGD